MTPSISNSDISAVLKGLFLSVSATCEKPCCTVAVSFVLPAAPDFVVINITPFAALEPYIEVADASFNTVTDSMSLALMPASVLDENANTVVAPSTIGTPSTTYKGELAALKDPTPLIRTFGLAPGCPVPVTPCNPATLPCRLSWKEARGLPSSSVDRTVVAEPVKDVFNELP